MSMRKSPGRRKKTSPLPPAPPTAKPKARWHFVTHADGVSQVAVRTISRHTREREQALADLRGGRPMLSTGERLLPISSILAEVLSELKVEEAELAPELLAAAWEKAVGGFLATQAQLTSLSDGVAGVRTTHPAVRFELQRNCKLIITKLNSALGEGSVRRLRIHHG